MEGEGFFRHEYPKERCPTCKAKMPSPLAMAVHPRCYKQSQFYEPPSIEHRYGVYKCKLCGERFYLFNDLHDHYEDHLTHEQKLYECLECHHRFGRKLRVQKHIIEVHGGSVWSNVQEENKTEVKGKIPVELKVEEINCKEGVSSIPLVLKQETPDVLSSSFSQTKHNKPKTERSSTVTSSSASGLSESKTMFVSRIFNIINEQRRAEPGLIPLPVNPVSSVPPNESFNQMSLKTPPKSFASSSNNGSKTSLRKKKASPKTLVQASAAEIDNDEFKEGIHFKIIPYNQLCDACEQIFQTPTLFRCHIDCFKTTDYFLSDEAALESGKRYQCPECLQKFEEASKLANHRMHMHYRKEDSLFQCMICQVKFLIKPQLIHHFNQVHKKDNSKKKAKASSGNKLEPNSVKVNATPKNKKKKPTSKKKSTTSAFVEDDDESTLDCFPVDDTSGSDLSSDDSDVVAAKEIEARLTFLRERNPLQCQFVYCKKIFETKDEIMSHLKEHFQTEEFKASFERSRPLCI